jgi:hypothetical protein
MWSLGIRVSEWDLCDILAAPSGPAVGLDSAPNSLPLSWLARCARSRSPSWVICTVSATRRQPDDLPDVTIAVRIQIWWDRRFRRGWAIQEDLRYWANAIRHRTRWIPKAARRRSNQGAVRPGRGGSRSPTLSSRASVLWLPRSHPSGFIRTSQKTNLARLTISPTSTRMGRGNIGPSNTSVWNSPFSPHESTPSGRSRRSDSSK